MIGILVVLYMMDDTIKDSEDGRKYPNLDTLAAFPVGKEAEDRRVYWKVKRILFWSVSLSALRCGIYRIRLSA
ncbi:MAG: hypothetical protein ACLSXO_00325 [Coprococcus sp.]